MAKSKKSRTKGTKKKHSGKIKSLESRIDKLEQGMKLTGSGFLEFGEALKKSYEAIERLKIRVSDLEKTRD